MSKATFLLPLFKEYNKFEKNGNHVSGIQVDLRLCIDLKSLEFSKFAWFPDVEKQICLNSCLYVSS